MDNVEWYYDIPLSPPTSHDKYCLKLLTVREIDPTSPNSRIDVLQACQSFQGLLVPWLQRGSRNNQSGHRVDLSSDWHRAEKAPEESKFGMVKPSQTCIDFVFFIDKKTISTNIPRRIPISSEISQLLAASQLDLWDLPGHVVGSHLRPWRPRCFGPPNRALPGLPWQGIPWPWPHPVGSMGGSHGPAPAEGPGPGEAPGEFWAHTHFGGAETGHSVHADWIASVLCGLEQYATRIRKCFVWS